MVSSFTDIDSVSGFTDFVGLPRDGILLSLLVGEGEPDLKWSLGLGFLFLFDHLNIDFISLVLKTEVQAIL